jgi:carbonic anhydrase
MPSHHGPEAGRAVCGCGRCAVLSRRQAIAVTAAGTIAFFGGHSAVGLTTLSPDGALARLMEGNVRFVGGGLTSFDEDLAILKQKTVTKQEPFAAVLSCADSRVPVELVFDQSIGHVFVCRVAGNVCTPEIIASLEYGATVLGVPLIVVLGHDGCGAVKASIDAKPVPGQISALYAPLRHAIQRAGGDLTAAIKANAQIQADLLRKASPVIATLVTSEKMKVVAAYYDLSTGKVMLLG